MRDALAILLSAASALSACGADRAGVLAVQFRLAPVSGVALPEGYDATAQSAASGSVEIDVAADFGTIVAIGLPPPPLGYDHTLELLVAEHGRDELPGLETTQQEESAGGHTHGAAVATSQAVAVPLGRMSPRNDGSWRLEVDGAMVAPRPLAGVRAATIMLEAGSGDVAVMSGDAADVENETPSAQPAAPTGGHNHGA